MEDKNELLKYTIPQLLRWRVRTRRVALSLRIDNLLDQRHEDIRGYPLPGRSWFGGIGVNL